MRLALRLRGTDANGKCFGGLAETEDVSTGGFLCICSLFLAKGVVAEVFLTAKGTKDQYVGFGRVVRREVCDASWQQYGFQFEETTDDWVLRK
jgi:hypothetical protein